MSHKTPHRAKLNGFSYSTLEKRNLLATLGWDGPGLHSAELTYYVGDAPDSIDQGAFESMISDAVNVWAEFADITFTRTSVPGLLDSLDFTSGIIDGPGDEIAHAYSPDDVVEPIIAGDVKFDNEELWEIGDENDEAFDLMYVAVHETGHALGLAHSFVFDVVMHPTIHPYYSFDQLHQDDVDAILDVYASREMLPPDPPINSGSGGGGGIVVGGFGGGKGGRGGKGGGGNSFLSGSDSGNSNQTDGVEDRFRDDMFEIFNRSQNGKKQLDTSLDSGLGNDDGLGFGLR